MPQYCADRNKSSKGSHEVHVDSCSYLPQAKDRLELGSHANCQSAVTAARRVYAQSVGCPVCSPDCK
ncbi:MAG: hypothetical protein R3332_01800 [Pseudohongiellaceae bacterium]|nr:hypothetical protein [Pseudohongiellaceae bacterium]